MKKIIILFFVCVLQSCGSIVELSSINWPINNFYYDGNNVNWEQVYEYQNTDSLKIANWFKSQFNITNNNDGKLYGNSRRSSLPYKKAGYGSMDIIILLRHPCEVFFTIDFKKDKYRIVVNNIIWYPEISFQTSKYTSTNSNFTISLDEVAFKNGGCNSIFLNTTSNQLDTILKIIFKASINNRDF